MKKFLLLLMLLLSGRALAEGPWRHYNLDVRLKVPAGWKIIQGPVMLNLNPKQAMKAERRPSFNLVWRQAPPSLGDFQKQMVDAVRQKGGRLLFARQLRLSGYPALRVRALMPEGPYKITADVVLIRVDQYAGYVVTMESFTLDTKAADPYFASILSSLKVGPRPRKTPLPVSVLPSHAGGE